MPAATQPVEDAAHLVAYWMDLQSVEPHELRGHLVLRRLLCALYVGLGVDEDWHVTAPFQVPMTDQPLVVTFLVGRVGRDVRATMREGNPKDIERHYPRSVLREHLESGDSGILESWGVWGNAYFLNAIRNALLRPAEGVAWTSLDGFPAASAPNLARQALHEAHVPPDVVQRFHLWWRSEAAPHDDRLAQRCRMVWKRAMQLDVRIPPQNIPLDQFARRNPPPGVPHKGHALTLTEFLCHYLVHELGMGATEAAERLGMDDPRQVRRAIQLAERKQAQWR